MCLRRTCADVPAALAERQILQQGLIAVVGEPLERYVLVCSRHLPRMDTDRKEARAWNQSVFVEYEGILRSVSK